ncbi:MAG TPA: chemotaxis protein CheX [Spirochaetota bacterium]|nr:chemotaxis protein CheX [Spirochaetota bacterium]HPJ37677.1 chemotaxis protein CheX [Spirochaetota bacterium]HPQ53532.1 chemotaxis protein CheX [Spirochaetota bacterium]
MKDYNKYSKLVVRSVNHIFKNFLKDPSIKEILVSQAGDDDPRVSIEIDGSLKGELIICFPGDTLNHITKFFFKGSAARSLKKHYEEVAGEIANLVTGTFANQLQFDNMDVRLSAPEFNDDTKTMRMLYTTVNLSFESGFGGFDVNLYYRAGE